MARHVKISCVPLLLLCLLCSFAGVASAQPWLTAAAQDGTGTVWALPDSSYGNDQSQDGKIYHWEAGKWAEQTIPEAAGFRSVTIAQGENGAVYALWQKRDSGWYPGQAQTAPTPCLLTVHRGTRSRLQSQFTAALPSRGPFSGPLKLYAGRREAWIVADAPRLLHLAFDGTVQSFSVTPDQVYGGKFMTGFPMPAFCSTVDPLGRRWFWQASPNSWQGGSLHGFLIWDGKTLAYHPTLPGLPDRPCSLVAPHGGRFLWAAQSAAMYPPDPKSHASLYKIDTRTLTAAPVALPPEAYPSKRSWQSIVRLFWIQGDLCMLETDYSQNRMFLWRQQEAAWRREPDDLAGDQYPSNSYGPGGPASQPVLGTAAGTWLGVSGAGLEWLRADRTQVVRVNWRRGLAAGHVGALFCLPDGNIMPFPFSGPGAMLSPKPPPLLPPRPGVALGTPGQPSGLGDMLADQNRRLWGLSYQSSGRQVLEEWDGRQWHAHLLPKFKGNIQSGTLYACDTLGRVWITVSLWDPPAQAQPVDTRFVFDPARDSWTQYGAVPEAVAAAAAQPGMAFLPYRNTFSPPVFSSDGRAAYADNQSVFLYDGKKWRSWKSRDIQPGYTYGNTPEKPRFDPDGHLQVALADHLYGWTPEDGWQPMGFAPAVSPPPSLPPGGPPGWIGQPVPDNTGGGWVAESGDVYLTRGGLWRRLAPLSGRGSPFFDGRALQSVLQDTQGRFFFETTPGGFYEYVVWTPPAVLLPAPRIEVRPLSPDSVRLYFHTASQGPCEFQWRLNGGAWRTPQAGQPETLTGLHPGTYRVEARAISPLLQATLVPSAALFVVQPPTAAQIARWVSVLSAGPDDAREIAIAGLMKQPALALPALRAARPAASELGKWWIDAAIQQITGAGQISAGETPEIAN